MTQQHEAQTDGGRLTSVQNPCKDEESFCPQGKLVVTGDLPQLNVSFGVNSNLLLYAKANDLSINNLAEEGGREGERE